jgi:hypothetical protein
MFPALRKQLPSLLVAWIFGFCVMLFHFANAPWRHLLRTCSRVAQTTPTFRDGCLGVIARNGRGERQKGSQLYLLWPQGSRNCSGVDHDQGNAGVVELRERNIQ